MLSPNSPNAGLVTSSVDFLEMETWAALRGPEMLHSFLPPQLKICHGNALEPYSPAALKIHVNSQHVRENRTVLRDKNSPKDRSWGCGSATKAGIGPKHGMGWPMCPHAAELMAVPLSTSPPHPFGQHHISDTF